MEDIEVCNGTFKYRWKSDFLGMIGCDVCDLKDEVDKCPKNCMKNGCYIMMSFDEMKIDRLHKIMKEQGIKLK